MKPFPVVVFLISSEFKRTRRWSIDGEYRIVWHFLTLNFVSNVIRTIQNLCPQTNIVSNVTIFCQNCKMIRHLKQNSMLSYVFDFDL